MKNNKTFIIYIYVSNNNFIQFISIVQVIVINFQSISNNGLLLNYYIF